MCNVTTLQRFTNCKMKKSLYFFILCFISCGVPQSDYDDLKSENESLKRQLNELNAPKEEIVHTETEALKHLKDYYEFYNNDFAYRRPKLRRINANTFVISLQTCINKKPFLNDDFHWNSQVLTMKINDDGTYKVN